MTEKKEQQELSKNKDMRTTKQLLISMLALLCCCTGAWASSIPGALSGRFTINASGEKVVFSQGNLQYVGTWQFAENQWDCFSTSQYNDHRDLFGWGTGDAPNKVSDNYGDYGTFTDWGTNAITNGGNTENSGWRTLTKDEWVYLFYSRENAATLFGFGRVNSMNGLIILPDNWTTPEGASFTASTTLGLINQGSNYHNDNNNNYSHNTYTAEQWAVMESAGAVFLPAAAYRHGADSNIDYTDLGGFYWSSTPSSTDKAYYLNFYSNDLDPQFKEMRYGGRPVRLVRSSLDQDNEGYYLLGSVQDWKDFATLVQTIPTANAKMTADIDLGDDQTKIGSYATRYSGTFDGQGHMLTFNYNTSSMSIESGQSYLGAAPFRDIEGATIRNVHTAGSITADKIGASGLVGWAYGTNTIENCWSDVNIVSSSDVADTFTGFVAFMYGTSINITDCIFTGRIQSTCKKSHSGFIGYHYSGTSALTNCLVILDEGSDTNQYSSWLTTFFTFDRFAKEDQSAGTYTNCYYYRDFGVAQGTKATSAQLADGTIATALQNGRAEEVWVQDPLTNQPMLKIFANAAYTVPSSGIGTFSAKAPFALPDGLNAYYCKGYNDGQISAVAINGVVPANTGVLLKGTPGETYTLTGTNSEAASVTDNALVAVTEQTDIDQIVKIGDVEYTNFGLSGGVFKKVNSSGGTVKANRAYLQIPTSALTSAAAEGIMLVWDEETDGIEIVQTSTVKPQHDDAWFTLDGRQLSGKPTAKGLYIVNGKKVIIK